MRFLLQFFCKMYFLYVWTPWKIWKSHFLAIFNPWKTQFSLTSETIWPNFRILGSNWLEPRIRQSCSLHLLCRICGSIKAEPQIWNARFLVPTGWNRKSGKVVHCICFAGSICGSIRRLRLKLFNQLYHQRPTTISKIIQITPHQKELTSASTSKVQQLLLRLRMVVAPNPSTESSSFRQAWLTCRKNMMRPLISSGSATSFPSPSWWYLYSLCSLSSIF